MPDPVVFILEDDSRDRVAISEALAKEGYHCKAAATGQEFLALLGTGRPQAVVLDIGLPDMDGRDVCRALRTFGVTAPILFLTRKGLLVDKLAGFDAGGDDYVVKPFEPQEIVARLRALRRRSEQSPSIERPASGLRLDPSIHAAVCGETRIRLSPTEYRVLAELAARPGVVVRRADLIHSGWPRGAMVRDNTLDAYVARIRRKLRDLPAPPTIETAHGIGYMLLPAAGDE
jgi:two-component system response regulator MprA